MVDTGCLCYGLCDPTYATRANLKRIEIKPFYMEAFDGEKARRPIREVAVTDLDLEGFTDRVWFYITPLGGYDMYLGMPWIRKRRVKIDKGGERIRIGGESPSGDWLPSATVRSEEAFSKETSQFAPARLISAAAWVSVKNRRGGGTQVFAASMADINKALQKKVYADPK